jgi:acetoin utilization deacetylase AcuC-like enzyme
MRMTAEGFAAIVRQLTAAAPDGAIAFVTEGGYDLEALASCLDASFAAIALDGPHVQALDAEIGGPAPRGERALEAVRAAQGPYWRGI